METASDILARLNKYYYSKKTLSLDFRLTQLGNLKKGILKYETQISEALYLDLGKSNCESFMTEIGIILEEISYVEKNLSKWIHPTKVHTPITQFGSKSYIYHQPHGTVLIIAPWNYPFNLVISPLIGAIAGGNTALLKSSAQVPHISKVVETLIEDTFDPDYIYFLKNGNDEVNEIIDVGVDFIMFTGSQTIGKQIMKRAAETLTPVTLELGGKSPVIVNKDANIEVAAERIVWGKFLNSGQTCIAPDHIFAHKDIKDTLITELIRNINKFYDSDPESSPSFSHIVNERQFNRLIGYIDEKKLVCGGKHNIDKLYIEPTILSNITYNDAVMKDEIFGPILPILEYTDINSVIDTIQAHDRPLATYIFSENEAFYTNLIETLHYGGGCVNDTISHIANHNLPFGGNGPSGMGQYHGRKSFETFTHDKGVLIKSTFFRMNIAFPPYTDKKLSFLKKILK